LDLSGLQLDLVVVSGKGVEGRVKRVCHCS
jgi:hypothetical protein